MTRNDLKYVSIGLTKNEEKQVEELREHFNLRSSAGAVRKALALIASMVNHMGEPVVEFEDKEGRRMSILLS